MLDESQSRRSIRKVIPCHWFEIKEEVLIVTTQDEEEPKTMMETLSYAIKKERRKAFIESVKEN